MMRRKRLIAPMVQALLLAALAPAAAAADAASPGPADAGLSQMEAARRANIETALAFHAAMLNGDIDGVRRYIAPGYIEHDPERRDGLAGVERAFELQRKQPRRRTMAYQLVLGDGDLVAVMGQLVTEPASARPAAPQPVTPGAGAAPPPAISTAGVPAGGPLIGPAIPSGVLSTSEQRAELFRIKDGKVAEHWITIQNRGNP